MKVCNEIIMLNGECSVYHVEGTAIDKATTYILV